MCRSPPPLWRSEAGGSLGFSGCQPSSKLPCLKGISQRVMKQDNVGWRCQVWWRMLVTPVVGRPRQDSWVHFPARIDCWVNSRLTRDIVEEEGSLPEDGIRSCLLASTYTHTHVCMHTTPPPRHEHARHVHTNFYRKKKVIFFILAMIIGGWKQLNRRLISHGAAI